MSACPCPLCKSLPLKAPRMSRVGRLLVRIHTRHLLATYGATKRWFATIDRQARRGLARLAAGKTPEERLKIMKDHQVGTFGVVGLILILGIKFLALDSLPDRAVTKTLFVALILSRWSMVQLTYRARYARREGGLGLPFKENLAKKEMVIATAISLVLSFFFYRFWGMLLWLAVGVFTLLLQKFFEKKIGGVTGDILGAANETNEALVLILMSGMLHWRY